jgi:hypothetical protein
MGCLVERYPSQGNRYLEKVLSWSYAFVIPVNPFMLNERLVIQQGLFLCAGDISIPFEDNLAMLQQNDSASAEALIAIELPPDTARKK